MTTFVKGQRVVVAEANAYDQGPYALPSPESAAGFYGHVIGVFDPPRDGVNKPIANALVLVRLSGHVDGRKIPQYLGGPDARSWPFWDWELQAVD